jgi:hypothetical protein
MDSHGPLRTSPRPIHINDLHTSPDITAETHPSYLLCSIAARFSHLAVCRI